jgi:hypothetical protein
MSTEELQFREWLPKISERLFFILLSVKEKRDITESDWDMLKYFHRIYWLGELPFFKQKLSLKEEVSVQQALFNDKTTDNTAGTKVDYSLSNLNK